MLRMIIKTMEKETREKMAANMEMINKLIEDMEDQVELVPDVGQVTIKHNLIISMHDGKEKLAAVTAKLEKCLIRYHLVWRAKQDIHLHLHGLLDTP